MPDDDDLDYTAKYNTPLAAPEQASYDAWTEDQSKKIGRDVKKDKYDYDLQGWWKQNSQDTEGGPQLSGAHLTDAFKKPNHPTFSTFSQYHGMDGNQGGQWEKAGNAWKFTPGRTNLKNFSPQELGDYFQKVEPGNQVMLPQAAAQ